MAGQPIAAMTDSIPDDHPLVLVWIDSREAVVARWEAGAIQVKRFRSDVPPHRRSTGHVRHDPMVRHGGGGSPQSAGEPRRLEHLARFLKDIELHLPRSQELLLLGPGTVHERLAREIRAHDAHHQDDREIRCEVAPRMTRRQLVARLRTASGVEPRRRTVGAHRWTHRAGPAAPAPGTPRGVVLKRSRNLAPQLEEVT